MRRLLAALVALALPAIAAAQFGGVGVVPGLIKAPPAQPASPGPSLHAPWSQCDVGSPPAAGTAINGGGTMSLSGAGDVGSNNNNNVLITHVANQPWSGDVDVVMQVTSIVGSFDWRQSGLVFMQAQCANTSPWVAGSATVETGGQQGVGFHLDGTVNGRSTSYSTGISGPLPPPQWIRLAKNGSVVSLYYGSSSTGPWTFADSETRSFSGTFYIGVFCASASTSSTELAACSVTEPIITTPIGSAGSLSFSLATQTVTEGSTFTPCVNRSSGSTGAISVHVHDNGTGTATGSDWTTSDLDQTVSFADGDSAQKCVGSPVRTTARAGTQGDRTINLALATFTGGASAGGQATQVVTIRDAAAVTGAKKFHPGYYVMLPRDYNTRTTQSARFGLYDRESASTFTGWTYWTVWAQLEGATHGDYTAGDAMLRAELLHLRNLASPKRLILGLDDELYRGSLTLYPTYLVNAGCVFQELWSDGVHYLFHFKWWLTTCANYYADLVTHLGTVLDGETNFEELMLDYEQALNGTSVNGGNGSQFNRTGFMNGLSTAFTAAAAAFPHTNLVWIGNWGITFHEADQVQEIGIAKPLGIGIGAEDACSIDPSTGENVYGTYPIYQDMQNVFAGYGGYDSGHHAGTYTDQRGAMFSSSGVEDSELGYNSVCNGQGFAGYATVGNGLRAAGYMDLYSEWNAEWNTHARVEYNMETGANVQRWAVGVTGSLWDLVTNHPLTHTACPTDYDILFGNGSVDSGCNRQ